MLMGSSNDGGVSGMHVSEGMIGRKFQHRRSFTQGDMPATFAQSACSADPANDWLSMWSFTATTTNGRLQSIANGNHDQKIRNWVQSVPAGHRVWWSFCHESDAKVAKGEATVADVNAAFVRAGQVMDQMRSEGVSQVVSGNVKLVMNLTNNNFNKQGSSHQNRFNTGLAACDSFALDIYGGAAGDNRNFPNWSADALAWINGTALTLVPEWGIWETSASDAKGTIETKSAWIEDSIRISYQNDARYYTAFDSGVNGSQPYFNRQIYADIFRAGMDLYADGETPPPTVTVPGAPTNVAATAGDASAQVTWSAPSSNGGASITSYTVTSSPGGLTASTGGSGRSATVTGLTNGTSYTFTVRATNSAGTGPASSASNSVTPTGGTQPPPPPPSTDGPYAPAAGTFTYIRLG